MPIKVKTVFIIIVLIVFTLIPFLSVYSSEEEDNSLTLVYISDLNLFPTPLISQREKHELEKQDGLLVYESQAVFQDIVRYINQKVTTDLVIFAGNNVVCSKPAFDMQVSDELIWNLFLDMASEIKVNFLVNLGQNEILSKSKNAILQMMKSFGQDIANTWWSYKIKDYLIIGLDSSLFFVDERQSRIELKWLKELLLNNKFLKTIIFTHKSLLTPEGVIIEKKSVKELFNILDKNPQVVLLASGGEYLNRIKIINHLVYVQNSSPVAYPCTFKIIQLTPEMLKIKTVNIPLKGVIKKAEMFLVESVRAKTLFQTSVKNVKKYVKGNKSDANFQIYFRNLSNR